MCYSCRVQRKISQRELRNDSGKIMRALEAGVSFLVTRNGVPVGELTPMRKAQPTKKEALLKSFEYVEPIDFKRLRDDFDRFFSQDIEPRE
jgi:antitoxin (DNA-binding transcriptional repressor) of toxin-antitoxin stability system